MNKFLFLSVLLLFSCRSSQDLTFLKDLTDGQNYEGTAGSEHLVKPGDILYVSIKSINPDINAIFNPEDGMERQSYGSYQKFTTPSGAYLYGYEVNDMGELSLPMLGKFKVTGLSVPKIEELVRAKTDILLKDAIVKIKLLNFKVTVLGEVRNPGVYFNYNNTFTVFEALAMANGNTDFANIANVKMVRPGVQGNISYTIDLSSKRIYLSKAFYLHPNDYVFVQPHKNKSLQLNSQAYSMALSSFSIVLAILAFASR